MNKFPVSFWVFADFKQSKPSFPVWLLWFRSELKLEDVSSAGDSVKQEGLFLIREFFFFFCAAHALDVFLFHLCSRHTPQSKAAMTMNLKTSPHRVSLRVCCVFLFTAFGLGVFASLVKMSVSEAFIPSIQKKRPSVPKRGQGWGRCAQQRLTVVLKAVPGPGTPSTRQVLPVCKVKQGARVSEVGLRLVFCWV